MATALVGEPFTFQVMWRDGLNVPVVVASPTIVVFRFDDLGEKVVLQASTAMTAVPLDTGRYVYVYDVLETLPAGSMLYGLMQATYGIQSMVFEQEVELVSQSTPSVNGGLIASFVK